MLFTRIYREDEYVLQFKTMDTVFCACFWPFWPNLCFLWVGFWPRGVWSQPKTFKKRCIQVKTIYWPSCVDFWPNVRHSGQIRDFWTVWLDFRPTWPLQVFANIRRRRATLGPSTAIFFATSAKLRGPLKWLCGPPNSAAWTPKKLRGPLLESVQNRPNFGDLAKFRLAI